MNIPILFPSCTVVYIHKRISHLAKNFVSEDKTPVTEWEAAGERGRRADMQDKPRLLNVTLNNIFNHKIL